MPLSLNLSPDAPCGEEKAGLSQALTHYRAEVQVSLESAWPCSWVEAREVQDIRGLQHLLYDRRT